MQYRIIRVLLASVGVPARALAVFTVTFIFCASPDVVVASCGDWLAESSHQGSRVEPTIALSQSVEIGVEFLPVTQPCHGPECRQRRSEHPTGPLTPVIESVPQQHACLLQQESHTSVPAEQCLLKATVRNGRLAPFILERPPRN